MKMLYDLAGRMHPKRHAEVVPDSAVLSVYYGAERNFAYNRYPLWFKRVDDLETEHQDARLPKRSQDDERVEDTTEGGRKKMRVRKGKQKDIGLLWGGFG